MLKDFIGCNLASLLVLLDGRRRDVWAFVTIGRRRRRRRLCVHLRGARRRHSTHTHKTHCHSPRPWQIKGAVSNRLHLLREKEDAAMPLPCEKRGQKSFRSNRPSPSLQRLKGGKWQKKVLFRWRSSLVPLARGHQQQQRHAEKEKGPAMRLLCSGGKDSSNWSTVGSSVRPVPSQSCKVARN